ncbi:hypothetical protein AB1K70_14330 [Bremerella sp. JC770]|uniref:hypothetical protein n=1 Tax=Bremerella sp. JC770 TaxID=3232137 RepID=UPI003457FE7D
MSSSHARPPGEQAPQVVVRAGQYFLCSACGTMVQVPEDVVGQLVTTIAAKSRELPEQAPTAEQAPSEQEPAAETVTATTPPTASVTAKTKAKTSSRVRFHFERIDGLVVPTSKQLDRALAWVSFHLKVLDRQGTERHRPSPVPCPRLRGHAIKGTAQPARGLSDSMQARHAHEDVGMAPELNRTLNGNEKPNDSENRNNSESKNHNEQERGPP